MTLHTRKLRVPEILQSSAMDCGPAALKAVLEGFGMAVPYDLLRERCQTDVDGTSLDQLAKLASELGLRSEQLMLPLDHVFLPEANSLPAIIVTRASSGLWHFVVAWRRVGPFVEIMDPGAGRRWLRAHKLLLDMPSFELPVSAERWRRWAAGRSAQAAWYARLRALGLSRSAARQQLAAASADPSWRGLATLDAATRMTSSLVGSGVVRRGPEAERALSLDIPGRFCWVTEAHSGPQQLRTRGAVFVKFSRGAPRAVPSYVAAASEPIVVAHSRLVPAAVQRALATPDWQPLPVLWTWLRARAGGALWLLLLALLLTAAAAPLEALLLRGLLDMHQHRALGYEQLTWVCATLVLVAAALGLEAWATRVVTDLGRQLEACVRAALLERLPRLADRYLSSRPSSDLAHRAHGVHLLRTLPMLWAQAVRAAAGVAALGCALCQLFPEGMWLIAALAGSALLVPFAGQRALSERALRVRTQSSSLDQFTLDALLGAAPTRAHGAARAIQHAHEALLTDFAQQAHALHRHQTALRALQALLTAALAGAVIAAYVAHVSHTQGLLVMVFLSLRLPLSADELSGALLMLREQRSLGLRALSPLSAAVDEPAADGVSTRTARAVALRYEAVHVISGGHAVLRDVTLQVAAGEHVGIVGVSGAGKSSLLGVLLGWAQPVSGRVTIDDLPLTPDTLQRLHKDLAWVDPAVQLWDQSLYENLTYAQGQSEDRTVTEVLSAAQLDDVLGQLPDGLRSTLGEGGVRVSGGQGQRVRLGRALMHPRPRLVLLDEPFRGLQRSWRRSLLTALRQHHWRESTLLVVSHDVDDLVELDRIVVLDKGKVAEVGKPDDLLKDPNSLFCQMRTRASRQRTELWRSGPFRSARVCDGRVQETEQA